MPRRPRVHLDNVPLHIGQRGHNLQPCFFTEEDYQSYLHWLSEALVESECALHARIKGSESLKTIIRHTNVTPAESTQENH